MAVRFVAVGELLVDVIAAGVGHGARISVRPAGSALNAASAAAAAGADAAVIGTVGDDAPGRMILAELAERGIEADVTVAAGPTGTFVLADGQIRVDRGVGHDLVLPDRIDADAVLVSGYVPAAGDALARAQAEWIGLDAGRMTEPPDGGNIVFASAPDEDAFNVRRRLGRRLAVVTLGADGAIAFDGDRVERVRPARITQDAPGCGDVFAATLLVALARGDDLADALAEATQAALDSLA